MARRAKVKIRTLRHWKQRFSKDAKFIWRKNVKFAGKDVKAGTPVDKKLVSATKLKRLWDANRIELAEFKAPSIRTGRVGTAEEQQAAKERQDAINAKRAATIQAKKDAAEKAKNDPGKAPESKNDNEGRETVTDVPDVEKLDL